MRGYWAFMKKEWMEQVRTYRCLILLSVFFALGVMNPLTAKLTPKLLEMMAVEGIQIVLPTPSAIDSYTQFFKNDVQMGYIALILVFGGMLANEISRGTLVHLLTKGLSRKAVILAKFSVAASSWTVSLLMSFLVTYGYTVWLFPGGGIYHLGFSVFCIWMFGIFLLAVLTLAAACSGSVMGSLLGTGAAVVTLFLIDMIPAVQKYNPVRLISNNVGMLQKGYQTADAATALVVAAVLCAVFVAGAVMVFRKKQI